MKLFDTFPTLEFNEEMMDILADVDVLKVATNSAKTRLRVYIVSKRLIPKHIIFALEDGFRKQIPPFKTLDIHVVEKYELSSQYTQEKLWGIYRESILEELKAESIFDYEILKKAKVVFTAHDRMELTVKDGNIVRDRITPLREYLHMVFFDRCGFEIDFDVIYKEAKHEAKETPVVHMQLAVVTEDGVTEGSQTASSDSAAGANDKKADEAQGTGAAAGRLKTDAKVFDKNKKGAAAKDDNKSSYRSVKLSPNPDVIYGKDFDDEAIELATITHEIGEGAIRGKIRGVEVKELRTGKQLITFNVTDFTDSMSVKLFLNSKENLDEIKNDINDGAFVKIKGVIAMDSWSKEIGVSSVRGIKKIPHTFCQYERRSL